MLSNMIDMNNIIEYDDIKPTNYNLLLLQTNKYKVIPIDHSFIFESLSYNYLNPNEFYPKDNDHLLVSELGIFIKKQFEINERFIQEEKNYFYNCIDACQKNFSVFIINLQIHYPLNDEDVENIYNFLFHKERNEKVFEEYIYRLKN